MSFSYMAPDGVENEKNCYFRAARILDNETPKVVDVAAESYYALYVNGKLVGQGPARGTRSVNFYDSYEMAPHLTSGSNVLSLLVCCMNIPTFVAAPSRPAFYVAFDGVPEKAGDWRVMAASDWRRDVAMYSTQTGFSEWRDMRSEPLGWMSGEGIEGWPAAIAIPPEDAIYDKKLLPRGIPFLDERVFQPVDAPLTALVPRVESLDDKGVAELVSTEEHRPAPASLREQAGAWVAGVEKELEIVSDGKGGGVAIVLDFGVEVTGRFELEVTGEESAVVDVAHGETLWDNRVRAALLGVYNMADRYVLRNGRQIVGNTLLERGFRMVQVVFRNFGKKLVVHSARATKSVYPYKRLGSFLCDDFALNKIWETCGETLSTCSTDIFVDCPWRERSFWVNDLLVENRTSLEMFGASEIHRRAFQMAFSDARPGGLVGGVCPCPDEHARLVFPATNLFMPMMLLDHLMYSGDASLVREFFPRVLRIFDALDEWADGDGLITPPSQIWNFFDHSFKMNKISLDGKNTAMLGFLYIMAVDAVLRLASITGTCVDADKFRFRAGKVSRALWRRFFREDERRLGDWLEPGGEASSHSSQLAHALALLSGEVPDGWRRDVEGALTDEKLLSPELYLHYFIFKAMRLCGMEDAALRVIRKYWAPIVEAGAPAIWEAGVHQKGKDAFGGAGSLCHGFATAPVDFMQTVILGVEPLSPGFREFRAAPSACGLKFASGRIPTPHGNIGVRWEKNGDSLSLELDVPEGTRAKLDDGQVFGPGTHRTTLSRMQVGN